MTREEILVNEDGETRVLWHDTAADLADAADRGPVRECDPGWTGETWKAALDGARRGRTALVADAERLLEQVQSEVLVSRSEWVRSRAGAFPVVPEALQGFPEPMRRKVWSPSDRSPLRVFVDLVSSAGVERAHLMRRGVACLALAMALGQERALELWAVIPARTGQRIVSVVQIPTTPFDLAGACYALTSVGFVRGLGYSLAKSVGGRHRHERWAFGYYPDSDAQRARYVRQLRAVLGASEVDLVVPPTFLGDPAAADSVGFVRRTLAEHSGGET